eukprot:TRINITY_DN2674_c0_g1_i5.p1 TRINITY_DN2674_c0_g1~~TRINITY_DN2674_c0_g1_i5.p1  ORF type:complete len:135 (-),score=18.29 TRINITY_DN2674_c0_g1_i5:216-620(-)
MWVSISIMPASLSPRDSIFLMSLEVVILEYYSGRKSKSSFTLVNEDGDKNIFSGLHPSKILHLQELSIPYDPKPETRNIGSNVLVCSIAGLMTVNHWVQGLMGLEMPNFTKSDIALFWKREEDLLAWAEPDDNA